MLKKLIPSLCLLLLIITAENTITYNLTTNWAWEVTYEQKGIWKQITSITIIDFSDTYHFLLYDLNINSYIKELKSTNLIYNFSHNNIDKKVNILHKKFSYIYHTAEDIIITANKYNTNIINMNMLLKQKQGNRTR